MSAKEKQVTRGFAAPGMSKAVAWDCKRCGHANKAGSTECAKCWHEPTLGRRDVEMARWNDSHRQED